MVNSARLILFVAATLLDVEPGVSDGFLELLHLLVR